MPREIPLTHGFVAIVDDGDYDRLIIYKWHVKHGPRTSYASRTKYEHLNGRKQFTTIRMHADILGKKSGFVVDHISRDGLDNRRCNLRWATKSQSCMNRISKNHAIGSKGVSVRDGGKYRARIQKFGESINLGNFTTKEEAVCAYNNAAIKIHGAYAVINIPRHN